jgi:hypothetical protein
VGAAIVALKAAYALCNRRTGRSILRAVAPALQQASALVSCEFRLIYEGSFGSVEKSAREARVLMGLLSHAKDRVPRARQFFHAAVALWYNGEREDAALWLAEALALGIAMQMPSIANCAIEQRFAAAVCAGNLNDAEKLSRQIAFPSSPSKSFLSRSADRDRVRLALLKGDSLTAANLIGPFESLWEGSHTRERLYLTEVRAQLRMQTEGWIPTELDINQIMRLHRRGRRFANHDAFVLMLVTALEKRGERTKARCIVEQYVRNFRRERGPLLAQLTEFMQKHDPGGSTSSRLS